MDVKIGDFHFRVKHFEDDKTASVKNHKKKYVSPSTQRRNVLRLEAFKAKKAAIEGKSPTRSGAAPPPLARMFRVKREALGWDCMWQMWPPPSTPLTDENSDKVELGRVDTSLLDMSKVD